MKIISSSALVPACILAHKLLPILSLPEKVQGWIANLFFGSPELRGDLILSGNFGFALHWCDSCSSSQLRSVEALESKLQYVQTP